MSAAGDTPVRGGGQFSDTEPLGAVLIVVRPTRASGIVGNVRWEATIRSAPGKDARHPRPPLRDDVSEPS